MGALTETFRQTCSCCQETAIPFVIRGRYEDGTRLIMQECPMCGYIIKHGSEDPLARIQRLSSPPPVDLDECGDLTKLLLLD